MPSKRPVRIELEAGKKYFWCQCGYSADIPFCDGSHRGASEKKSLCFTAEKDGQALLCTCQATKNPPYCDGSHKWID